MNLFIHEFFVFSRKKREITNYHRDLTGIKDKKVLIEHLKIYL
jgi:hypothetical protein